MNTTKTKPQTITLDRATFEKLERLAESLQISKSDAVRLALKKGLPKIQRLVP